MNSNLRRAIMLLLALVLAACSHGSRPAGECDWIAGMWRGENIEPDPGSDPGAVDVMRDVVRAEQWRITRVTETGMQRERVGMQGGPPVAEAMFVLANTRTQCVVELRSHGATRRLVFSPRAGGLMGVRTEGAWFAGTYRRR